MRPLLTDPLLSVLEAGLLNGGSSGLIYGFIFAWVGSIMQVLTMAEMGSMYVHANVMCSTHLTRLFQDSTRRWAIQLVRQFGNIVPGPPSSLLTLRSKGGHSCSSELFQILELPNRLDHHHCMASRS